MSKVIDLNKTIKELSKEHNDFLLIMKELGFESITNPAMLNTAGRMMTIPKGAQMKGISLDIIKETFIKHGYTIEE